jgi:hypothetical protein
MKTPGRFLFLLLAALSVALPASLSAQNSRFAEITVYVCPAEGGSETDRAYFDFNLPEEVKGSGYTLANTLYRTAAEARDSSHFYITVTLSYDEEYYENVVVTELYDTRSNAQILTSSMGYQNVQEMNEWNLTIIYSLMANAPAVKHIMDLPEEQVKWDAFLAWMEQQERYATRHSLYLGLRAGYSNRFYMEQSSEFIAPSEGNTFEVGFQASFQPLPLLAVQAEFVVTMDDAVFQYYEAKEGAEVLKRSQTEYRSVSLMIPLTVKLTLRPERFLIAPFGGLYLSLPLGGMENDYQRTFQTDDGDEVVVESPSGFTFPVVGLTAGIDLGTRVGPGTLFLDLRYSADLDTVKRPKSDSSEYSGKDLYKRSMFSISLGYEFGLLKK